MPSPAVAPSPAEGVGRQRSVQGRAAPQLAEPLQRSFARSPRLGRRTSVSPSPLSEPSTLNELSQTVTEPLAWLKISSADGATSVYMRSDEHVMHAICESIMQGSCPAASLELSLVPSCVTWSTVYDICGQAHTVHDSRPYGFRIPMYHGSWYVRNS